MHPQHARQLAASVRFTKEIIGGNIYVLLSRLGYSRNDYMVQSVR
jgi:hypothetical protein